MFEFLNCFNFEGYWIVWGMFGEGLLFVLVYGMLFLLQVWCWIVLWFVWCYCVYFYDLFGYGQFDMLDVDVLLGCQNVLFGVLLNEWKFVWLCVFVYDYGGVIVLCVYFFDGIVYVDFMLVNLVVIVL